MEGRFGILIVEDDFIQTKALEKMLKSLNHIVLGTAVSGQNAVELVVELDPDIIFMDILLTKEMDGVTATQEINKISDATIFFLTGNSWVKDDDRLKSTKFEDILIKPISIIEITVALSKIF